MSRFRCGFSIRTNRNKIIQETFPAYGWAAAGRVLGFLTGKKDSHDAYRAGCPVD